MSSTDNKNEGTDNEYHVTDLASCEWEPIHIPGRIQSHGLLIAVDSVKKCICYCSDNMKEFTGVESTQILDKDLTNFIALTGINTGYVDILRLADPGIVTDYDDVNPVTVKLRGKVYNLIVHPSGKFIVFELEPQQIETEGELQRVMGISLSKILEAKSLDTMLQFSARQVKEIIGYDRVMIYKFWEDDHGEVIAEEKNTELETFMGLHYPASDIPRQARELYKLNLVRIIADVSTTPAALAVKDPKYSYAPLDLTHSTLRAVSPVHIEYLRNMGVKASFSISIIVKDRLWGLIACHNYEPKFIDYKARNSTKLIGKILSSSLEYREDAEKKESARVFQAVLQQIVNTAIKGWDVEDSLMKGTNNILKVTNASGAALLYENKLYTTGNTPSEEEIHALVKWLNVTNKSSLFHTTHLSAQYPGAAEYKDIASGLMSCRLSKEMNEFVLWFKPEFKKTVNWAGNPEKPVETDEQGNMKLSPRRSFAIWSQEVEGVAVPWASAEIASVMKLREEVVFIINEKANQIRKLNEELQKAYDELDTFSFTISHDLKTPLATIKNYTEILLEDYSDLPEDAKNILKKVVKGTDRMNLLIKEILSYSRIDRREMNFVEVDMKSLLENVISETAAAFSCSDTKFTVTGTANLKGDRTMIYQAFTNIIGNAVKYSSKSENPAVEIACKVTDNEIIYTIKDNGIGIDINYGNQVFELFKRLENARKYEGTGVGLAIVKRIMEKHSAKIWYENVMPSGTMFYLSFKKTAEI